MALDGKFIRDTIGIVCLVDHETGVPLAMAPASRKEGEGERCELKVAQNLIEQHQDLSHACVTADALHCQARTVQQIVARGGAFLVQAKDNQKTVHRLAAELTPTLPLFDHTQKAHGRETHRLALVDPLDVNFPHVETVLHVRRHSSPRRKPRWEAAYYLSRHPPIPTPEQWLQTIRDHWAGVEIRNHWRKDACLFEDKTRSRNPHLVGNLILLRNLVLFFFAQHRETYRSLPAFVETVASSPALALRLIRSAK